APSATPTLAATDTPTATLTLIPTNTLPPTSTPTRTPTATWTWTPSPTLTPTFTPSASATPAATLTVTRGPTATPPAAGSSPTLQDHYYLARPLSDNAINYAARTYPYGGTAGGRLQVHIGQDMENPTGTPVLAAADGVVVHAGDDLTTQLGLYNNYYGNAVILQHNFTDSTGEPVYTLYGHLSRVAVAPGQSVSRGDVIGYVGAAGIAQGPHLHFEVRVGNPYDYHATRNPDLWIFPYFGFGTLAGRIADSAGNLLRDATLTVVSDTATRYTFSYAGEPANSDSLFGENWTLGDLPEGYYTVRVSESGRVRFEQQVYVFPSKTTWVDVVLTP
ncbi:MAG: peptidoglycan DD-metalloendopeptidase family protein, partial [Anaerolineae bacterium]|nr:peptidoglycan DD-metalloendopeptidase family protein [Anaerolineae bacterium]